MTWKPLYTSLSVEFAQELRHARVLAVQGAKITAADVKVRAERKAGELLDKMEKRAGARDGKTGSHDVTPLLSDIGISKMQSHRWQRIARVPTKAFEQYIATTKAEGEGDHHVVTTQVFFWIGQSTMDSRKGLRGWSCVDWSLCRW